MNDEQGKRKEDEDRERTPPAPSQGGCPRCGGTVKTNMFRTGSVNHPGGPMKVCTHCGTRS